MTFQKPVRHALFSVLMIMGLVSSTAYAQSSVGAGPLTGTLTDTEPTIGVLSKGPLKLAPGITVQQLGWDDNVFDEPATASPKQDYVVEVQPDSRRSPVCASCGCRPTPGLESRISRNTRPSVRLAMTIAGASTFS